jgi:lipopolysaccharide biosynthesis glycosyltransferase
MPRHLVVTLGDENYQPMMALTSPRAEAYAHRINADFHVITKRLYAEANICYEKFQIHSFLRSYDRVLYVDGDVLIRENTPDVFAMVPPGYFAAMDEAKHLLLWTEESIREQFSPYGWEGPWNGRHFNAGVMMFDRTHASLFEKPIITNLPYWDQPYFNVMTDRLHIPFFDLPPEFNFMVFHHYRSQTINKDQAYMLHFAGWHKSVGEKVLAVRSELHK